MALVTGASAGIGWSTCEVLAEAGMRVVAVARRRERLEALQQQLVSRGVPIVDFLPVVCDITKVLTPVLSSLPMHTMGRPGSLASRRLDASTAAWPLNHCETLYS